VWTFLHAAEIIKPSPLESALATQFNEARESGASTDGNHLKEKVSHIAAHLEIANRWINRFKRRQDIVYRTLTGESRSVDPESAEHWKNYRLS
jgi:hypothetical protein